MDFTIVGNRDASAPTVVASRRCRDNPKCATEVILDSQWPADAFSLSHIAIPFAPDDPLYGGQDAAAAPDAYHLGQVRAIGERHVLVIPAEDVNRIRHNPFFAYLKTRALEFCKACESTTRTADAAAQ